MPDVEDELATQPACWREAVAVAARHRDVMPAAGERVAVVGCGTSRYMAEAYAERREATGHGETDAFPASEYRSRRSYDRVVFITRSGTTTEVLDALSALPADTRTLAVTADGRTPVAALATDTIALEHAAERSVVQTRFPTTALAVLRAGIGDDLVTVIADGEQALRDPLPVAFIEHHQFTFLGAGWAAPVASEAALKCREAAGVWTEAYPAMEYRHGPMSVSGPGTVVWVFGPPPDGLTEEVMATGATLVTSRLDPMAELVRAQRLAVALAVRHGRDPDHPRSLAFSVVLERRAG